MNALDELKQANRLCNPLSKQVVYFRRQAIDFVSNRAVNVVANQIVDMFDGDELPDLVLAQPHLWMSQ